MRAPSFGAPSSDLYAAAHEMTTWADQSGFHTLLVGEHHGTDDGYTSSPAVLAASLAAATSRIKVRLSALLLPLHDPIDVAEQIATLDLLTNGRVEVVFGMGYVPQEYAMFGVDMTTRAALMDERVRAVVDALQGPTTFQGRPVHVTPSSSQRPHPPIYMGGAVRASALRAARLNVGFVEQTANAILVDTYLEECRRLERTPCPVMRVPAHYSVFVAEDVEKAWVDLSPYVVHNANAYNSMASAGNIKGPFASQIDPHDQAAIRSRGGCKVLTPEECVQHLVRAAESGTMVQFVPLLGGIDPEFGWRSLELLRSLVLPRLDDAGVAWQGIDGET